MFKESLISIILFIVIYQIYNTYYCKNIDNEVIQEKKVTNNMQELLPEPRVNHEIKPMQYETPQTFEHPVLGKPTKVIDEGYLYIIKNPQPWNAIVFNPTKEFKYLFIIKLNINNSNVNVYANKIGKWSNIIEGIQFNPNTGELIIPSSDDNTALAITNLVINNLKGDLNLKNIVENNLIQISIAKIQSYSSIRSKIIEQIIENIHGENLGHTEENLDYQEDLAETANAPSVNSEQVEENEKPNQMESVQPLAYEGNEYSYL